MSIKHVLLASALSFGLAGPALAAGEGDAAGAKTGTSAGTDMQTGTGASSGTEMQSGTGATGVAPTTPADPNSTMDSQTGSGAADSTAPSSTMQGSTGQGATGMTGTAEVDAKDIVGRDVVGLDGESVGTVDEVVYDAQGQVSKIILEVGGILGIGAKTVAVDRTQIQGDLRGTEDQPLTISMTEEQLENAPAYDAEAETGMRSGTN